MRSVHEIQIEQIRHVLDLDEKDEIVKAIVDLKNEIEIAEEKHKEEIEDLKTEHENEISDMFTQSDVDEIRGEDKAELTDERDTLQDQLDSLLALIGMSSDDLDVLSLDLRHNPVKFLVSRLQAVAPYTLAGHFATVKDFRAVWPKHAPNVEPVIVKRRARKVVAK